MLPHSFPVFPDSGSHFFSPRQDSIMSCHASPVALLHEKMHTNRSAAMKEAESYSFMHVNMFLNNQEKEIQNQDNYKN